MEDIDRAVTQILISQGSVEDSLLQSYIRRLGGGTFSCAEGFKKININLRKLSLEVRTVIMKGENNQRIQYHGIANMLEDLISNKNSTSYTTEEILFFRDLIDKLLFSRELSSGDIRRGEKMSESEKDALLERFRIDCWLQRSGRGYWIIGPRTYLELRTYLEGVLRSIADDAGEGEELQAMRDSLSKLPQILFY